MNAIATRFHREFTGLLDKNDTEIQEGAVLSGPEGRKVVIYSDEFAAFVAEHRAGHYTHLHQDVASVYEVVGNIHDKPNFLK